MPTTREVLEITIALEKQSMALYARFAKIFAGDAELHDFWFGMARDEARHVGALDLVSTVLEIEGMLDGPSPISLARPTILKLRAMLERFHRDAASRASRFSAHSRLHWKWKRPRSKIWSPNC